jgi:predicted AlkP superfamily phosphohydrolase/phosphomutase
MTPARGVAVYLLLGFATAAVACGRSPSTERRVIVLGIDGMDFKVTRELMARGALPNLSRLAASGAFSALATSMPPQSPVAWSTFTTGEDPDGHGIYDFVHRDPATRLPFLSTTHTAPPRWTVSLGGWTLPLSGAQVTQQRQGRPFWDVLERAGVATTIVRMPANFPPSGQASRELSGMGTPDLAGTYGTSSFFSSSPPPSAGGMASTRVVPVDVLDGVVRSELTGPAHPFRVNAPPLRMAFSVHLDSVTSTALIEIDDERRVLREGEWSDWVPIDFRPLPFQSLRAIARLYLKQVRPVFELYVSPLNIDPVSPAMRISTPQGWAGELAASTGRYHTQGIAEDTKALSEQLITRDEFLKQAALMGAETERQYWTVFDGFDGGLLFHHFGNLDQVSHMMWRPRDPEHPAYDPERDPPYASVVDNLYIAFDRLVGETVKRMGPDTLLIVMSDHGFTSWRRSFHLNNWLRARGYLSAPDARPAAAGMFQQVDWSRTRAYALGLNALYLNLAGREQGGMVAAGERDRLIEEIRQGLLGIVDPATGKAAVTTVVATRNQNGPDLLVGYADGYRVSNESALGDLTGDVFSDNRSEWSGDHCIDPAVVPGLLVSSRPLRLTSPTLQTLAVAILSEFSVTTGARR